MYLVPLDTEKGNSTNDFIDTEDVSLTDNYSDLTGLLPELAAGVMTLYAAGNVLLEIK